MVEFLPQVPSTLPGTVSLCSELLIWVRLEELSMTSFLHVFLDLPTLVRFACAQVGGSSGDGAVCVSNWHPSMELRESRDVMGPLSSP